MNTPKRKDAVQVELDARIKVHRAAVRLKHTLAADAEIAETLPDVVEAFKREIEAGEMRQLNVGGLA